MKPYLQYRRNKTHLGKVFKVPKSHRRHPAGVFQHGIFHSGKMDNLLKSKCLAEEHDYAESIRRNMAGFQSKPSCFPAMPGCLSLGQPNLFLQVLRTFRLHDKLSAACQTLDYLIKKSIHFFYRNFSLFQLVWSL